MKSRRFPVGDNGENRDEIADYEKHGNIQGEEFETANLALTSANRKGPLWPLQFGRDLFGLAHDSQHIQTGNFFDVFFCVAAIEQLGQEAWIT